MMSSTVRSPSPRTSRRDRRWRGPVRASRPTCSVPLAGAATPGGRFGRVGIQMACAAVLSLVAALMTSGLLNSIVEADAPVVTTTVFLWLASLAVMTLFLGMFGIALPLGALTVFATTSMNGTLRTIRQSRPHSTSRPIRPQTPRGQAPRAAG